MSQIFYHRIVIQIKLRILGFFLIKWISMEFCPQKLNNRQTFLPLKDNYIITKCAINKNDCNVLNKN